MPEEIAKAVARQLTGMVDGLTPPADAGLHSIARAGGSWADATVARRPVAHGSGLSMGAEGAVA